MFRITNTFLLLYSLRMIIKLLFFFLSHEDTTIRFYNKENKDNDETDVTFDDVAGCDEAKFE